jgi:hypothetical protein
LLMKVTKLSELYNKRSQESISATYHLPPSTVLLKSAIQ